MKHSRHRPCAPMALGCSGVRKIMGFEVRPNWLQTMASPLTNATTLGGLPNPSLGLHVLTF